MTSRKEFEAHIRKQFPTASDDLLLGRSSNGRYGSMVTEHAWLAWQASALSAPEAEPVAWIVLAEFDGKMVPQSPARPTRERAEHDAKWFYADNEKAHVAPLYLHPSAPERKPMTLDEIKSNPVIRYFGGNSGEKIVREVEAFHDIKEAP